MVQCSRAGAYQHCVGCPHATPHERVPDIKTYSAGRGRTCRSWGACVVAPHTGRRLDREHVVKVRCVRLEA